MIYTKVTRLALNIAYKAHRNQRDKAGLPYIFHPYETASGMDDELTCAAALLHDVIEDTNITAKELLKRSVPAEVVEIVELLTRRSDEDYFDYIRKIKKNPAAVKVKLADLEHNSDRTRIEEITGADMERFKRYEKAREILLS